ncbi:formimidoylglutamase [Saccharicrinis aurantiacus]|uniref:formimidoylglutamase n=1 Tax=Saccharicrinis aurantiacus TaxID=1849719 RepID=UPI002490A3C7|nr:formimidoylglutamase [Saccharicrinis aurantiacus]
MTTKNHIPASKELWQGRATSVDNEYWYQIIDCLQPTDSLSNYNYAIVGYACHEGVKRNQGRLGAAEGPDAIRNKLAKVPVHFSDIKIADAGNIPCVDNNMEACQDAYAKVITQALKAQCFPVGIGGGHDIAYATFKGIWNSFEADNKPKIGIINFDAHFDFRVKIEVGNSGTPFYQIIEEHPKNVEYLAIGIQQQGNTRALFNYAESKKLSFIPWENCEEYGDGFEKIKAELNQFASKVDHLYITIDLDAFSSAFAPGVSAPSALGITPKFALKVLTELLSSQKVIALDIAELNPSLDQDNVTAGLAARMIDYVVNQ